MKNPKTSAHVNGHIALADLKNAATCRSTLNAQERPDHNRPGCQSRRSPTTRFEVTGLRATLGKSNIEASGTLQDPQGQGRPAVQIRPGARELGRLAKLTCEPEGEVLLNGTAKLDAAYNYEADGNIEAQERLHRAADSSSIRNVNLARPCTSIRITSISGLRLIGARRRVCRQRWPARTSRAITSTAACAISTSSSCRTQFAPKQKLPYDGVALGHGQRHAATPRRPASRAWWPARI